MTAERGAAGRTIARGFALACVTVATYLPALRGGFIWDDDNHLTANASIVGNLGFKSIWTSVHADYFPLAISNLWLQHALWGLRPLPYHGVTVLFHAACAVALWRVLARLGMPGSWLGAALWALHPVQVESVAWISELKNTQSAFFYLISIWAFLAWTKAEAGANPGRARWAYALALAAAALAILSKSSTVVLPAILALCSWRVAGRLDRRALWRLAPFVAMALAAAAWTVWEQKFHAGALGPEWDVSWPRRLAVAGDDIWFYLGKLALPALCFIYPRWQPDARSPAAFLPLVAAAGLLFLLWRPRRDGLPAVLFGCLVFGFALAPVLGFFNVYFFRYSFVADHFQYLASMGPLALAGAGLARLLGLLPVRWAPFRPVLCALPLAGLAAASWGQCAIYRSDTALFTSVIERNSGCWMAYNNLGMILAGENRPSEALPYLEKALRLKPDYVEAHSNMSVVLIQLGRPGDALDQCEAVVRLNPDYAQAYNNLGVALKAMGRREDAIREFETAVKLSPDYLDPRLNLAELLLNMNRVTAAIPHLEAIERLRPGNAQVENDLGVAYFKQGRTSDAIAHLEAAIRLDPGFVAARRSLGLVLQNDGQAAKAKAQFDAASRLERGGKEAP